MEVISNHLRQKWLTYSIWIGILFMNFQKYNTQTKLLPMHIIFKSLWNQHTFFVQFRKKFLKTKSFFKNKFHWQSFNNSAWKVSAMNKLCHSCTRAIQTESIPIGYQCPRFDAIVVNSDICRYGIAVSIECNNTPLYDILFPLLQWKTFSFEHNMH